MAKTTKDTISRRGLLIKLGLATGAAYVAPTFAGMDIAKASTGSPASAPSGPSAPSRPSAPSTPSMPSGASVPSRPTGASGQPAFQWRWDPETWTWVQVTTAP
ncbi:MULTISPECIES: hypothetical protein [unclassified Yoonia]|uniref:hypothetical protein n=1 Tax=unclassified Yoonia TaxID=2629118 RepID=UPI002AFFC031|nr:MULTISPECIES: hypothetical protein [unclassified Yoonia]